MSTSKRWVFRSYVRGKSLAERLENVITHTNNFVSFGDFSYDVRGGVFGCVCIEIWKNTRTHAEASHHLFTLERNRKKDHAFCQWMASSSFVLLLNNK